MGNVIKALAPLLFVINFTACGASVGQVLDDWRAAIIAVVALIIMVVAAAIICDGDD